MEINKKDFFIGGTAPALGGVIDMVTQAGDFSIVNTDYFFICIETAAPIVVQLADGNAFTITTVSATTYLGSWYPVLIKKVIKAGTTGKFSFGY
jgi:hypothetical protein